MVVDAVLLVTWVASEFREAYRRGPKPVDVRKPDEWAKITRVMDRRFGDKWKH
jgi:hypothetical protein